MPPLDVDDRKTDQDGDERAGHHGLGRRAEAHEGGHDEHGADGGSCAAERPDAALAAVVDEHGPACAPTPAPAADPDARTVVEGGHFPTRLAFACVGELQALA